MLCIILAVGVSDRGFLFLETRSGNTVVRYIMIPGVDCWVDLLSSQRVMVCLLL